MEKGEEPSEESLEQEVFKALDHQRRRDIIRYIGEKKNSTFTEIMNATKLPDSPTLSYHLRSLAPFIEQSNGRYHLTPIGKDAYTLLLRTTTYNKLALFQKKRHGATFGNILLWGIAIIAAAYLEADTVLITIILPFCAFIASGTTYYLFE